MTGGQSRPYYIEMVSFTSVKGNLALVVMSHSCVEMIAMLYDLKMVFISFIRLWNREPLFVPMMDLYYERLSIVYSTITHQWLRP